MNNFDITQHEVPTISPGQWRIIALPLGGTITRIDVEPKPNGVRFDLCAVHNPGWNLRPTEGTSEIRLFDCSLKVLRMKELEQGKFGAFIWPDHGVNLFPVGGLDTNRLIALNIRFRNDRKRFVKNLVVIVYRMRTMPQNFL